MVPNQSNHSGQSKYTTQKSTEPANQQMYEADMKCKWVMIGFTSTFTSD